ncbi:MAG: channel protein TolC [Gammaproteobacteria bacterium HGW-Gammaproteobacteria-3]|nr:MAG: channel protein TolC [Gammaproteobacteria bacterium HGW-Gammaproteobacteria-3]
MGKFLLYFKKSFYCLVLIGIQNQAFSQDLIEIYQLALYSDPVSKQALALQNATAETRDQSIARLLPNFSATAASTRNYLHNKKAGNDFRGAQVNQSFWDQTFNLNFIQPVFHWDYWVQLSQSDNQIAQTEADYWAEQQNLMVRITEAYFNVLSAQDTLEFAGAEKKAIARQLDQAQQRFEVGLIPITDIYEAQAGFDQARADEIEAENDLGNKKEALKEIIGEYETTLAPLGEHLALIDPKPSDMSAWSKAAASNNLSIASAFNQSEFARKAIELQTAGHLPQLDIVGSYFVSDNNSTFGFRGDSQNIGLQLSLPLFEGGAVNSRIRQARQDYIAAREKLVETQRAVNRLVKDAYRGVISNISRVEALKATVKSAKSALEAAEAGFEVGTRTMVDVLALQRNLYRAKTNYARSRYDYLIDSIKLKQATSSLTEADLEYINNFLEH